MSIWNGIRMAGVKLGLAKNDPTLDDELRATIGMLASRITPFSDDDDVAPEKTCYIYAASKDGNGFLIVGPENSRNKGFFLVETERWRSDAGQTAKEVRHVPASSAEFHRRLAEMAAAEDRVFVHFYQGDDRELPHPGYLDLGMVTS